MINNEATKIQNQKDLKFYRFVIAMAFVVSAAIALVVGIATVDSYKAEANLTNSFINALMPKSIEGTEEGGAKGITFYREKNADYDPNNNQPIDAFKYYTLGEDGKKNYLEGGIYYPPEYYMENSNGESIAVYLGFYYEFLQNLQVFKNALSVVLSLLCLVILAALIYIWYRSWSKREDARKAREEEYNKKFSKQ